MSLDRSSFRRKFAGFFRGWRIIIFGSWLNILLILVPISWSLNFVMGEALLLKFIFCILALIPLVELHDLSTHELALRIGGSRTGLVSASLSNMVSIVVAISALRKCELTLVQSSLIGSMLSKLLLVLGLCFFAGGTRFSEQGFDPTATNLHITLLSVGVAALLFPALYHFAISGAASALPDDQKEDILQMSHGVSIVLLFIYMAYLVFQLWSHTHLYGDHHNEKSKVLFTKERKTSGLNYPFSHSTDSLVHPQKTHIRELYLTPMSHRASSSQLSLVTPESKFATGSQISLSEFEPTVRYTPNGGYPLSRENTYSSTSSTIVDTERQGSGAETPDRIVIHHPEPRVSLPLTILLLVIVTVTASVTADQLVEAMDGVSMNISKEWVGLILLPAVTSIAECLTAVNVSVKDQLTLSISVAIGSAIQTAFFVIPFVVSLAWATGKPLSLLMDPFQSVVLYISVQTMSYVVADGKSNWLDGLILMCLYIVIAISFWFYPGSDLPTSLATCVSDFD